MNSDPGGSAPESNYVMGRTSDEYERLAGVGMITAVYRSLLPLALKHGITTQERSDWFFEEIRKLGSTNHYVLSPSLISAWKQKPAPGP
jgi:hypothetical protein